MPEPLKTEKIRAYLLDEDDKFIMLGREYKVTSIANGIIYYRPLSSFNTTKYYINDGLMSANSRELLLLICPPRLPANYSFINN